MSGKTGQDEPELWCVFCGKWGNHQSGAHDSTKPEKAQVDSALGLIVKDFRLSESFEFGAGAYSIDQAGEGYFVTVTKVKKNEK